MFRTFPGQIIRRNHCIYAALGNCYSVQLTVSYAGFITDSQLYRTASTKCRINTVVPPDDGLGEVRNV